MKAQYDAFTSLLEPEDADKGWDWDGLFHYMKKVCNFQLCTSLPRSHDLERQSAFHLPTQLNEPSVRTPFQPITVLTGPSAPRSRQACSRVQRTLTSLILCAM